MSVKRPWFVAPLLLAALLLMPFHSVRAEEDQAAWKSAPAKKSGEVIFKVVSVEDDDYDPVEAGRRAGKLLKEKIGDAPLKAVVVAECFEDREYKEKLLTGIGQVLPKELIVGGSTYGVFSQSGCTGFDSVCLLGIAGDGVGVAAALVTGLGTSKLTLDEHGEQIARKLRTAGGQLAKSLPQTDRDRLLILVADAHSPKNQFLVEGAQTVVGKRFPITGGSANKNAGQTFVYFRGRVFHDSAVALMLSGDFQVSLSGRQAKENDKVISTARQSAAAALAGVTGRPVAALAFNCAGRRGKLDNVADELAAIQEALGKDLPLFGCYCAGEIGPLDTTEKDAAALSGGAGWHVMFTVIGK